MELASYSMLRLERRGRILEIALNRPEKLNAVNRALHGELARVFREAATDGGSDVVILTGTGKCFSAGGDLGFLEECVADPAEFERVAYEGKQIVHALLELEKPVIAKVNGPAVGLGATLALFCDIVFMADDAHLSDPHVRVGLVAGDGGAVIWPQLVGFARAKEFLFTGKPVGAADAVAMGLANRALPAAELDAAVEAFAEGLAKGALGAIRGTKVAVNIALKQLAHSIMDAGTTLEVLSSRSEDHRIAIQAFRAKERPRFVGR